MAITTNIPPQAYTRDILVKAIEWISHQPPAVRERASSADLIVSFYLQARRRMTAAQLEAPVSGENFKQDLKHLAEDLKQFEEPSAPPTPARPDGPSLYSPNRSLSSVQGPNHQHNHLHTAPAPVAQAHSHSHSQQHVHLHVQHAPAPVNLPQVQNEPAASTVAWSCDAKSLAFAREIQERFNLSSEGEALRMLITLGIQRARELFP